MRPLDRTHKHPPTANSRAGDSEPTAQLLREKPGVLVVDDDHLVRVLVQLGLERDGFDVWLACNGREAIRLYRAHRDRIGVVLLEVQMAGPDGSALLDALRQLNPEVLACVMSGDPGADESEDLCQRGATCVIAKPFLMHELASTLRLLTPGVPADLLPSGGANQG